MFSILWSISAVLLHKIKNFKSILNYHERMNDFFDDFRMNMKYYREQRKLSQSELAIQANSSNGMIGNIESGKAKPSFDNILKIASALDVHPADLFLRNASTTVKNTKSLLKTELIPQIEEFVEKRL